MLISRIGLGCMSVSPDNKSSERIIHEAIDSGINFFDTADLYDKGRNETMLGLVLKGKREQVFIASKVGNRPRKDGDGWDWDPSRQYILSSIDQTLSRLGTDYLDLYQLHGGTIDDPIPETIDAFEELKKQGKILHYGISSIRPNVIKEWVAKSNISSVMMQYSLLDQRPEEECFGILQDHGVGVLVRGAVAQGILVNKPAKTYAGRSAEQATAARDLVHRHSANNRTAAQTSIQFVLNHPAVSSAIVGISTLDQLHEAVKVFDISWLTAQETSEMKTGLQPNFYTEHRI